ncbi:JmjC domain-containing protein [Tanacetum coccineum]|uniref:JmjC domain-containing protein n=1 Tax=Tanacetum coccineum TaxID=301880 RepID=A0ABQ5B7E8_9ASTR
MYKQLKYDVNYSKFLRKWLIRNALFILRKWTPSSNLSKEELSFVPVWFKFHGVLVSAFTGDGLSVIATCLGTPMIVDCALKDTMVISIPNRNGNGCPKRVIADLRKQGGTSNDGFQTVQRKDVRGPLTTSTPLSNAFSVLDEDNEKPMDDLVDDTRKKVGASPKKTSILSGRKADSPKSNVVFSPETKVHCFDRDNMEFDDMEQVVEEEGHGSASSGNG